MHDPQGSNPLPSGRGPASTPPAEPGERLIGLALRASAALPVLLLAALVVGLLDSGWSSTSAAVPSDDLVARVVGTLVVTGLGTALAVPVGLAVAIHLAELGSAGLRRWLEPMLELLAGLPALVYAWVAVAVLVPGLERLVPGLTGSRTPMAALVLALMIVPTLAALSKDALRTVPRELRLAALALGASPLRVLRVVVVPAAAPGLVSAALIAVSRAVGETMLVTLAVGQLPAHGLDPREAVAPLVAASRHGAVAGVGVPVLVCVLMVLSASAVALRHRHERRRDG